MNKTKQNSLNNQVFHSHTSIFAWCVSQTLVYLWSEQQRILSQLFWTILTVILTNYVHALLIWSLPLSPPHACDVWQEAMVTQNLSAPEPMPWWVHWATDCSYQLHIEIEPACCKIKFLNNFAGWSSCWSQSTSLLAAKSVAHNHQWTLAASWQKVFLEPSCY